MSRIARSEGSLHARRFDVICAGATTFRVDTAGDEPRLISTSPAIEVARRLNGRGKSVALITNLPDDEAGNEVLAKLRSTTIEGSAIRVRPTASSLVLFERGSDTHTIVPHRSDLDAVEVPESWSAALLFLSALSPVVSANAAYCKCARAARRRGDYVVLDLSIRRRLWFDQDPRALRAILQEADIVHATPDDLANLGVGPQTLMSMMRSQAVLVSRDVRGAAHAQGPFGRITLSESTATPRLLVSICLELLARGEMRPETWERASRRAD